MRKCIGELSGSARLPFAGQTRKEALASIREAIREWLAAEADEAKLFKVSEAEVAI
jgi:predicted RNase H-like HicB family nuclease